MKKPNFTTMVLTLTLLLTGMVAIAATDSSIEPLSADCQLRIHEYGPFDYRRVSQSQRDIVEKYHFDEHFEAYQQGKERVHFRSKASGGVREGGGTSFTAGGFDYTLNAFPNHPRALAAVENLGYRQKTGKVPHMSMSVHCYFQRAIRQAPDDGLVRAIYGYYHARRNQPAEARMQLAKAVELMPEDLNVMVYVATAYLEIKDLDQAQLYASKAYALGYPFPGLRTKIEKAGRKIVIPIPVRDPGVIEGSDKNIAN